MAGCIHGSKKNDCLRCESNEKKAAMPIVKQVKKVCAKCGGRKWYQYSTHGTPHSKPCEDCCKHNQGWWKLERHYGLDNGKWCCKAGCGYTVIRKPEEYATT